MDVQGQAVHVDIGSGAVEAERAAFICGDCELPFRNAATAAEASLRRMQQNFCICSSKWFIFVNTWYFCISSF